MDPSNIARWILLIMTLSVLSKTRTHIQAQQVPYCMFLFGDSQFDIGNNNRLLTFAHSDYSPYGIDFQYGPTGRFSNGRNIVDFLTETLGFDNRISAFADAADTDILRGINYASGGAGILDETGSTLLGLLHYTMDMELRFHQAIHDRIAQLLQYKKAVIDEYFSRCLYVINIGSSDYLYNYYLPQPGGSPSSRLYTPDRFAERLIQKFSGQLTNLYINGARKVAVFGLGLLGCVPQQLANYPTNESPCVDSINNAVQLFNNRLPTLIDSLNSRLPGSQFTFINITSISQGDPSLNGIRVSNASCCPVVANTGLCVRNGVACSNRDEYGFWDGYNPTEIVSRATASRSYRALLPNDAYPLDIRGLVKLLK